MKRDLEFEVTIVEKFAAVAPVLDERGRHEIELESSKVGVYDALVRDARGSKPLSQG